MSITNIDGCSCPELTSHPGRVTPFEGRAGEFGTPAPVRHSRDRSRDRSRPNPSIADTPSPPPVVLPRQGVVSFLAGSSGDGDNAGEERRGKAINTGENPPRAKIHAGGRPPRAAVNAVESQRGKKPLRGKSATSARSARSFKNARSSSRRRGRRGLGRERRRAFRPSRSGGPFCGPVLAPACRKDAS